MTKRMMRFAIALVIAMIGQTSASLAAGENVGKAIKASGVTEIRGNIRGEPVAIQIRTRTLAPDISKRTDRLPGLSCTGSRSPCSVLEGMNIQVQGKNVFVPKSAFIGLSDVVNASLSVDGPRYVLRIVGGDASEAYLVSLVFDRDRVLSRTVATPTEPNALVEESTFHSVTVGD